MTDGDTRTDQQRAADHRTFRQCVNILETVHLHDFRVVEAGPRASYAISFNNWLKEQHQLLASLVRDHAHYWGGFYGPADTKFLALVLAHRFMDRQGGNAEHINAAWLRFVPVDLRDPEIAP